MNISEANASAELSVIVGHPEDRNQGYGAEAISTILDYAFGDLDLNRVGLSVFEFNEDAISTYEKLGFREEGRLRQALKRDAGSELLLELSRDTPDLGVHVLVGQRPLALEGKAQGDALLAPGDLRPFVDVEDARLGEDGAVQRSYRS